MMKANSNIVFFVIIFIKAMMVCYTNNKQEKEV